MKSMRNRLLLKILAALILGILLSSLGVYFMARREVNELFDQQLRQIVDSLPSGSFNIAGASLSLKEMRDEDFALQIFSPSGELVYVSNPHASEVQRATLGFSTVVTINERWRVYVAQQPERFVQVLQPTSVRAAHAAGAAWRVSIPLLLLLPGLGLVIWLALRTELGALARLATAVGSRNSASLHAVSDLEFPSEIQPLIDSLNDLLRRLALSLDLLRAFTADAAHELRTPLTAIRLQSQLAERAGNSDDRRIAFADLHDGLARAAHLIDQLLTLARHEPELNASQLQRVDLHDLVTATVGERSAIAAQKNIDIGLIESPQLFVQGSAAALQILLGNLIDNAIRCSPINGRINVVLYRLDQRCVIEIVDSGPGIPAEDRERVFHRFYRRPGAAPGGSGLGLAIVRRIADQHAAKIRLDDASIGSGLRVRIIFAEV
jgi:two-component system OmpR family sensor kinase